MNDKKLSMKALDAGLVWKISQWLYKTERKIDSEYRGTICLDDPVANLDLIEPRIRPLILEMNQSNYFKTIASCQGHIGYFPYPHVFVNHPYVYFKAEEFVYVELFKNLLDIGYAPIKMRYGFAIPKLLMHPDLGVCMCIDLIYGCNWVTRKQIDVDIACLRKTIAGVVKQLTDDAENPQSIHNIKTMTGHA